MSGTSVNNDHGQVVIKLLPFDSFWQMLAKGITPKEMKRMERIKPQTWIQLSEDECGVKKILFDFTETNQFHSCRLIYVVPFYGKA